MKIPYNKKLKYFARKLRKFGTKGEAILWRDVLKSRQMKGYQFNRQFPIDNCIVDFVARKINLIIEIAGNSHPGKSKEDFERQKPVNSKTINERIMVGSNNKRRFNIFKMLFSFHFSLKYYF